MLLVHSLQPRHQAKDGSLRHRGQPTQVNTVQVAWRLGRWRRSTEGGWDSLRMGRGLPQAFKKLIAFRSRSPIVCFVAWTGCSSDWWIFRWTVSVQWWF